MGCVNSTSHLNNAPLNNTDNFGDADEREEAIPSSENEFIIEENLLVQRIEPEPQEELDVNDSRAENMRIQIDNSLNIFSVLDNDPPQIDEEPIENYLVLPRPLHLGDDENEDHLDVNDLGDLPNMAQTPVLRRSRARWSILPLPLPQTDEVFVFDIDQMEDADDGAYDEEEEEEEKDPYVDGFLYGREITDFLMNKTNLEEKINTLQKYICYICQDILQNPLVLIPCGHDLCRRCYINMKKNLQNREIPCGICRKAINITTPTRFFPPSIRARDFLDSPEYQVHCIFYYSNNTLKNPREKGCRHAVPIHKFKEHISNCSHRNDTCKYCEKSFPFETLHDHERDCGEEHKKITFSRNFDDGEDECLSEEALVKDLNANEVFLEVQTEANIPMIIDNIDDGD